MVLLKHGDIFQSSCQVIANPVNTHGIMGAGLARDFKSRFPVLNDEYMALCREGTLVTGRPYLQKRVPESWVLLFPTKDDWRNPSLMSYIVDGLMHVRATYRDWNMSSLALPALGCGLGGLEPVEVYKNVCECLNPAQGLSVEFYCDMLPLDSSSP